MNPLELAKDTLQVEAKAIESAAAKLTEKSIEQLKGLYDRLLSTGGSLVFSGVGKSGQVARKMSSTFMSLGQASFFLHPNEALHGDLGTLKKQDVVVWISYSGTTEEITKLMPHIPIPSENWVALVGNVNSPIAENSRLVFDCSVERETCLNNLAPTTSTTLALAMGDMMAVLYEDHVGVTKERFALNHPGGLLGKSLSLKVKNLMIPRSECAVLSENSLFSELLVEMTKFNVMGCAILGENDVLKGIIVEGDFRRALQKNKNLNSTKASDLMNPSPIQIHPDALAFEALKLMENRESQIGVLPVVKDQTFLGFIRIHDLVKEGFARTK